jgi:hypothetical protein
MSLYFKQIYIETHLFEINFYRNTEQ